MLRGMPIFDNHIHFRPEHLGVDGARLFEKAGGTALLLTHSPYDDVPITRGADYERAYRKTLAMAEAIRSGTALRVFVALGPYPVELLSLGERLGLPEAIRAQMLGLDLAAKHIAGHEAVAFGEIGRPHFPVPPDVVTACNDVIARAMELAKDLACAVVLHTEDPTPATFAEFAAMAGRVGLDPGRVVKHHSTPYSRPEDTSGVVPSILAKQDLVRRALVGGDRFLLETDYIDDPKRPGAVLGPATVPKKTKAWLGSGLLSYRQAWTIHKDLPERTYGIDLA
jgi:TatD-related deoxyribonuclease